MKKISALLSFLILFTAFTCENEPLDGDFVLDDGTDTTLSCEEATQNTVTATTNFSGVTPDDANYTELCLAYQYALQNQIDACGDDESTLQAIISALGNCGDENETPECEAASVVVAQAETAYNNDNTNEDICNTYKNALQIQINECGDADGSLQAIIDGLGDCSTSNQYFYAKVNGVEYNYHTLEIAEESFVIRIWADNSSNTSEELIFIAIPLDAESGSQYSVAAPTGDILYLDAETRVHWGYKEPEGGVSVVDWNPDVVALVIEAHDPVNKIISGTFNFNGHMYLTPDDINEVTEGAFTINY